jgi:flavin-dependent thymidylate synthase
MCAVMSAPRVRLVNTFTSPFDNAVATARTCYSSRVITPEDVARDDEARALRDRIARSTYDAGHHTTLQHAHFQFTVEGVSRQALWSFLHAHPFYNSEQVSQRYVAVKAGHYTRPAMHEAAAARFDACVARMHETYAALTQMLLPAAARFFFEVFPARGKAGVRDQWQGALKKKAQEVARYALPVATHAHLYHTVSGLTLHRYHRMCLETDAPEEVRAMVTAMVAAVGAVDPLFFREVEPVREAAPSAPTPLPPRDPAAFVARFDEALDGRTSRLVDWKLHAERTIADAVREVLGCSPEALDDDAAIARALDPARNPALSETLNVNTLDRVTRALHHPHYTFRKKLSHSADSQDQRHRMIPGSRPMLTRVFAGGRTPDVVVPALLQATPEAHAFFVERMTEVWGVIEDLRSEGVSDEAALYLLPNAYPIRFEESGDLLYQHHKWTTRLCYNAQEEIWNATRDEVEQVRAVHPRIGRHLLPPCGLRAAAGRKPYCPEGPRYCGVPVWRLDPADWSRVI